MNRQTAAILLSPMVVVLLAAVGVLVWPTQPGAAPILLLCAYVLGLIGVFIFCVPFDSIARRQNWRTIWHYAFAGVLAGCVPPFAISIIITRPGLVTFPQSYVLIAPLSTFVFVTFWWIIGRRHAV
jgi:hypothetical protein